MSYILVLLQDSFGFHRDFVGSRSAKWWVPITFAAPHAGNSFNKTYNEIWLTPAEDMRVIHGMPRSNSPVIFNVQETG